MRDYRRAFEWCDRIAEFAERYGSGYMRGFCREHYGAVHLSRGRCDGRGERRHARALADQPERAATLDREFLGFAERSNRGAPDGPAEYRYEYLLVVARKRAR